MIWMSNARWDIWLAYMALSYTLFVISKRFTDAGNDIQFTRGNFGKEISLWQALSGFLSHPTAKAFVALVAGMWALRIGMSLTPQGVWAWQDLAVAVAVLVIWPIVEWIVHVYVLHAQPITLWGRKFDPLFAQIHRAHHRNPYHPYFGIVPPATLVQYGLLIPGFIAIFIIWPRPVTMGAMVATMAFRYELWHYLIHSAYKPKSRWFRKLRDRHWWHHFHNEGYWYGITTVAGDVLLGTNVEPKDVPSSPTARTLGHDHPSIPRTEREQETAAAG
jgi:hypothetical protein